MSTEADQINYIKQILIDLIVKDLPNQSLLKYDLKSLIQFNGFMSQVYDLSLETEEISSKKKNHRRIFLKFMKGDAEARKLSSTLFENEIYIYKTVIPYYEKVIQGAPKSSVKISSWMPRLYIALFGQIDGLNSKSTESLLALENLTPYGFRIGPRLHLDRKHLLLMIKSLAEYHSLTYVLRIRKDPKLETLIDGIIPLPFAKEDGLSMFHALYVPAFERFFSYFDKIKDTLQDDDFKANVKKFQRHYGTRPLELLERFRQTDEIFSVILHGDFNRNNVLFQYKKEEGFDNPKDVRIIDFQELRYGSPVIDLSFCMYMNMDPAIRDDFWLELLKFYHSTVIKSIADILEVDVEHEDLKPYSFDKFYEHFSKFAFYGAIVSMHFLPWMASSEEDCAEIGALYDHDMFGDPFKAKAIEIGGDRANEIVFDIVRHANREGYLNSIFEL